MKGVERADQYLSYCTILKIHKIEQKVALYSVPLESTSYRTQDQD
jgi:hypothetical protein